MGKMLKYFVWCVVICATWCIIRGEDQSPSARLCTLFENALKQQKPEEIKKQLDEVASDPYIPESGKLLVSKLQAILAGSREVGLASDAGLDYTDAADILFLLERLKRW